jgi:hypothetical protein
VSDDPLRGIDFSERIKPLMQQVVLLDQRRMTEIADLKRQLQVVRGAAGRALERCEVATDPSGAADEAAAILREVVNLDGTPAKP